MEILLFLFPPYLPHTHSHHLYFFYTFLKLPIAMAPMPMLRRPLWWAVLVVALWPAVGWGSWCIARSGASEKALQAALDYACGAAGAADCAPIQASGLCYLPNTLPAHASYAFNSVFQRSRAAPGACDFAGTATVTLTDPSYGSCTYPASASTAGEASGTPGSTTPSGIPSPPGIGGGDTGLNEPGFGSNDSNSGARLSVSLLSIVLSCFIYLYLLFL